MARWKPLVRKDSYMPNNKMTPLVIGNGYTTDWGANGLPPVYETVTGNPVSFSTVQAAPLRQLEVAFSPVQSLHGYDAPWPAGGGKNLFNKATIADNKWINDQGEVQNATGYWLSDYIPVIAGETYFRPTTGSSRNAYYASDKSFVSYFTTQNTALTTPEGAAYIRFVGTGTTYNEVQFEKGTTPTAYSPYENLCPISGWDSLNVEQRGKNLCGGLIAGTGIGSGGRIAQAAFDMHYGKVKKGETYTVTTDEAQLVCGFFDVEPANGIYSYDRTRVVQNSKTIVAPIDGYLAFRTSENYANAQLELGSTPSAYTPYNPSSRSISISLGETVYSGWVDAISGAGEVTMASVDFDSLYWYAAGHRFNTTTPISNAKGGNHAYCICSKYKSDVGAATKTVDGSICFANNGYIYVYDTTFSGDATAFKTAMNGVQLVYELATTIPIQLTPQEVESLAGDNVLFSDANGDLTVEHRSN